jgi:hypothetical protein
MSKIDRYRYNPSLSVAENARINGVDEDSMRYYIKSMGIDRRYEAKVSIVEDIRKYLTGHPNATKAEVVRATGHGINTVRRYWDIALGEDSSALSKIGNKITKKGLRQFHNFYATHPSCVSDILRVETFNHFVLEPFCGIGSISEVLKKHGYEVESYDIVDRGYGKVGDFFEVDFEQGWYDIVSNPPYTENLTDIINRCISLCHSKVALLMPLRYLSGAERYREIYQINPPARIYVYQERIGIAMNGDFEKYNDPGANREIYAWYIWQKDYTGVTELHWLHNDRTETSQSDFLP